MNIADIPIVGLVYRFTIGDYHYTGSTCETIHQRYKTHLSQYKTHCSSEESTRKVYEFIKNFDGEWASVKVSILEKDIPIEKLLMKEQSYINKEDPFCLNAYNPVAPLVKVHFKQNRTPQKMEYDTAYYEKNKEALKRLRRERWLKDKEDPEKYAKHLKQTREAMARHKQKKTVS